MNKYNQLREEIIKAVPEIVRLKFGCKVLIKDVDDNGISIITVLDEGIIETIDYIDNCKKPYWCAGSYIQTEIKKIIGRDITLEDCMIAIGETNYIFSMNDDGFLWAMNAETLGKGECFWKPNIPLQDQSDECKELLWDLICKK